MHRALFHARRATDDQMQDLDVEIPQKLYNILVEYTKLDNSDLILVLYVEGNKFKWRLISENWLRQQLDRKNVGKYVI